MSERMVQVTVRFTCEQLDAIEVLVDEGEFPSQSEAIRAAIRAHRSRGDGHRGSELR